MTTNKILFREEQKFRVWWLWLILVGAFAVSAGPLWYGVWSQLTTGVPWGDEPTGDTALVVTTLLVTLLMGGLILLVVLVRLETEITTADIAFRFSPFVSKWRRIPREMIARFEAGRYNPIMDYGGWGVRQSLGKKGKAYNVSGNLGLTLYLVDGKKLLIGTRRLQAISYAMDNMMKGMPRSEEKRMS